MNLMHCFWMNVFKYVHWFIRIFRDDGLSCKHFGFYVSVDNVQAYEHTCTEDNVLLLNFHLTM